MHKEIVGTIVLSKNLAAKTRIVCNQGGTRSSKTYSIAQVLIGNLLGVKGKLLTITRKTMPSLKMSAMRDFFRILNDLGLYQESLHNKSDNTYTLNDNLVEFIGLDIPQ